MRYAWLVFWLILCAALAFLIHQGFKLGTVQLFRDHRTAWIWAIPLIMILATYVAWKCLVRFCEGDCYKKVAFVPEGFFLAGDALLTVSLVLTLPVQLGILFRLFVS